MLSYRDPSPFARYDALRHPIPHVLIALKLPRPHADSKGSELEFGFLYCLHIGAESRKSSSEKPLLFIGWLVGVTTGVFPTLRRVAVGVVKQKITPTDHDGGRTSIRIT